MDTASPRKSRADAHQRILPRRRRADGWSRVKDAVWPAWSIVHLVRASIAVFTEVGRTEDGVTNVLVSKKAQPEKQMNPLIALLRVVRLSLALPSGFAWDAPSLSRHPNDYGMEPASPGRLLFRASAFASAPDVSEHPPRIRYPLHAGGQHLVRAGGNGYITEAHRLDGAVRLPGGIARGG